MKGPRNRTVDAQGNDLHYLNDRDVERTGISISSELYSVRCMSKRLGEVFMEGMEVGRSVKQKETALALRRIADAIEAGKVLNIQINGRRVRLAQDPIFEIQCSKRNSEEIDVEMRWDNISGH